MNSLSVLYHRKIEQKFRRPTDKISLKQKQNRTSLCFSDGGIGLIENERIRGFLVLVLGNIEFSSKSFSSILIDTR